MIPSYSARGKWKKIFIANEIDANSFSIFQPKKKTFRPLEAKIYKILDGVFQSECHSIKFDVCQRAPVMSEAEFVGWGNLTMMKNETSFARSVECQKKCVHRSSHPSGPSRESKTSGISWEIIKSSIENDHHHSFLLLRFSLHHSRHVHELIYIDLNYFITSILYFYLIPISVESISVIELFFFGSLDHSWKCSQKRVSHHYVYELIKFEVLLYIESSRRFFASCVSSISFESFEFLHICSLFFLFSIKKSSTLFDDE